MKDADIQTIETQIESYDPHMRAIVRQEHSGEWRILIDRYQGNLFSSSADSVQIFIAPGCYLGKILFPEVCANVTFGGTKRNRLFVTDRSSLYAIDLKTHDVPTGFS